MTIYRACFLLVFHIDLLKGQYSYISPCNGEYNYPTARYVCEIIGGRMITMDAVDIYKDLIFEKRNGKGTTKFWIKKTQGLSHSNKSSICDTKLGNCRYVEMKNNKVVCIESRCNRKIPILCEADKLNYTNHCSLLLTLSAPRALGRAKIDYLTTSDMTTGADGINKTFQSTEIFLIGSLDFVIVIGGLFLLLTLSSFLVFFYIDSSA